MSALQPVSPAYGQGQVVTPAAGAASVNLRQGDRQVILTNTGANVCYVRVVSDGSVASTADYCVPAGAQVCVTKAPNDVTLSHISPSGTTLHIITGNGW